MDRKVVNIILQIVFAIWVFMTLTILVVILCSDACLQDNLKYIIQIAISLLCSIWLGVCIFKRTSENKLK
jgi:uncharacterized membrane protein YqjE